MKWWKKTVFYEIYLPSFFDSNADGIGDLAGVLKKIDYLKSLGVGGIWLTPFYQSPKVDNGYDVSDYYQIDSDYGNFDNWRNLVSYAHQRGIKIIVDMVLNHTSTQHPWFQASRKSRHDPKREWYIWRNEPNNWDSFFGGSAWEFDEQTEEYYYHSFSKEQADLNWTNPEVRSEMFRVLDFWIDLGIDGVRLDVINNLSVSIEMPDNPVADSGEQIHKYDVNQKGILSAIRSIKKHLYSKDSELFVVGEVSSDELSVIRKYVGESLLDTTFNFNLGSIEQFSAKKIVDELAAMKELYQDGTLPTLFFNSHDMARSWNRLASGQLDRYLQLAVLVLLNCGIPFLFQGEESGIGDFIPEDVRSIRDIQAMTKYLSEIEKGSSVDSALAQANSVNRDKSRGFMPWEEAAESAPKWIGYGKVNADCCEIVDWYKRLLAIRATYISHQKPLENLTWQDDLISYEIGQLVIYLNFNNQRDCEVMIPPNSKLLLGRGKLEDSGTCCLLSRNGIWIGQKGRN